VAGLCACVNDMEEGVYGLKCGCCYSLVLDIWKEHIEVTFLLLLLVLVSKKVQM